MPPRHGKRVATVTTRSDLTPEVQGRAAVSEQTAEEFTTGSGSREETAL